MNEVLRVTALGEFIWHPEADRLIEEGDFGGSPSMPFILKALRRQEWQGLTDEEIASAMDYWSDPVRSSYGGAHSANEEYVDMIATWRYIEAKLRSKNES
jgi:hypothetical protein